MSMAALLLLIIYCNQFSPQAWPGSPLVQAKITQDAFSSSEVKQLTAELYSREKGTRNRVKDRLVAIADLSPEARIAIIHEMVSILDDAARIAEMGLYPTWYDAAELLGKLKAIEAIDTLINYLDFTDGVSGFSASHRPAVKAAVDIGEPAIPRLSDALFQGQPSIRMCAAEALGLIKGSQAKMVLEYALTTEQDKAVVKEINRSLSYISRTLVKE